VRNPARERSRNLNREVWESPSVYGGEDVKERQRQKVLGLAKKFSPISYLYYHTFLIYFDRLPSNSS
jgi:hypothetical protein